MFWFLLIVAVPVAVGLYGYSTTGWDIEIFFLGTQLGLAVVAIVLLLTGIGVVVWTNVGWGL